MLIGALSSGCSTLEGTAKPPEPAQDRTDLTDRTDSGASSAPLESVLIYFRGLQNRSESDLRRERDVARQAFASSASEFNRVCLALVLSMPAASVKDERRALELLEPMTRSSSASDTPLRGFALVIYSLLREQHKLGGETQALKNKLDALKSLEKSMVERERSAPGGVR